MILRRLMVVVCLGASATVFAGGVLAETTPVAPQIAPDVAQRMAAFSQTLQIGDVLDVMRSEGLDYGKTLEDELFPEAGGAQWQSTLESIYDLTAMRSEFDAVISEELADDPAALTEMETFFASARGQNLLRLEIEARRAMLDKDVEDVAKATAKKLRAAKDPLMDQIDRFAKAGDLIEMNVAGALNANLSFYRGMSREGAFGEDMSEDQMLKEVWSQEPDVRSETESWLFPFLAMAYAPASTEDVEAYIQFSESTAGQKLNAALFKAFDRIFSRVSLNLGQAAGRQVSGDDI